MIKTIAMKTVLVGSETFTVVKMESGISVYKHLVDDFGVAHKANVTRVIGSQALINVLTQYAIDTLESV